MNTHCTENDRLGHDEDELAALLIAGGSLV